MALVLNMNAGLRIECTGPVTIECLEASGGWTRLRFIAPDSTRVHRLDENGKIIGSQKKSFGERCENPDIIRRRPAKNV